MFKNHKEAITIVIPVRNEEGSILKTLHSIHSKVKIPCKVIIADGCSTDQTFSLVSKYSKTHKNVRIFRTPPDKSGFKDSLDLGIDKATTGVVVVMMGDLCDDPNTVNKMYRKIQHGADMVVGSRYMPGGKKIKDPILQGSISRAVSKTLHLLTDLPIHDVSNPYRMYRKNLLASIKTQSKANEVPIEVIYKAFFMGAKIAEVPTIWRGRKSGKSKFRLLKVVPSYAKLYIWVLLNSWKRGWLKF